MFFITCIIDTWLAILPILNYTWYYSGTFYASWQLADPLCLLYPRYAPKTSNSNSAFKRRKLNSATWITEHPVNNCAKLGFLLYGLYSATACTNLNFLYRNSYIGFSPYIYLYILYAIIGSLQMSDIIYLLPSGFKQPLNRQKKHNLHKYFYWKAICYLFITCGFNFIYSSSYKICKTTHLLATNIFYGR